MSAASSAIAKALIWRAVRQAFSAVMFSTASGAFCIGFEVKGMAIALPLVGGALKESDKIDSDYWLQIGLFVLTNLATAGASIYLSCGRQEII
jgi:hypothetical protein